MTTLLERAADARRRASAFASEYPFEPHFLNLGGATMHYVDEGPRNAEPLLFLHGNPTWSFLWREAVKRFSAERRCVAPDHIGCGFSDKPRDFPYRLETHITNVEKLVDALGLERITLVVHDWGGAIGCGFAVRRPEKVARLVVMNTAAFTGIRAPLRIRACHVPVLGPLAVLGFNAFARAASVMATERRGGLEEPVKRGLLAPYGSWSERIATLRFVQDIPLTPAHPSWSTLMDIEHGLERLQHVPMCLIWGERDWCFTPVYRAEWQRRFPKAEVHIAERAGHWVMEDAREEVLGWMQQFLAAHPLP